MQILHLDSSILADSSASRALSQAIVAGLLRQHPTATVAYRDLVAEAIPHLDGAIAAGFRPITPPAHAATAVEHARSQTLVAELLASDILVIGAPMYNFSVATGLRAWFDHVLRAGETFRYTEAGPEGLLGPKRVIVVESRGGLYSEGPAQAFDFQEPYLRHLLGFIGLSDVTFVRAEKIGFGPEARAEAIAAATAALRHIADVAEAA